jgi:hypothetical protein
MNRTLAVVVLLGGILGTIVPDRAAAQSLPAITGLQYSPIVPGSSECLAGSGFGASQGSSSLLLNGTAASVFEWLDYEICLWTPSDLVAGSAAFQVVTAAGSSNAWNFSVVGPPAVTSISPTNGPPGTPVTITGSSFGSPQGSGSIWFQNQNLTPTSWSDTQIVVTIPSGMSVGTFTFNILANRTWACSPSFHVTGPPLIQWLQ